MSRTPIQLSKEQLEEAINSAEKGVAQVNRSFVFENACQYLFNIYNIRCSPAFLYLKTKELGVQMLTPVGKRGRARGSTVSSTPKEAKPITGKVSKRIDLNSEEVKGSFAKMEESFLALFPKETSTVAKIKAGNIRMAIKANCLICSSDKQSVADCSLRKCPMWNWRPFQNKRTILTFNGKSPAKVEEEIPEEVET